MKCILSVHCILSNYDTLPSVKIRRGCNVHKLGECRTLRGQARATVGLYCMYSSQIDN